MYVILGATGHTGSVAAEKLLAAGQKVRVIGRDAKRLERFSQKGAEAVVADATDAAALEKAFAGARAVYALIPPAIDKPDVRAYQEKVSDAIASAIQKSGVSHVVLLSSTGADKPSGTGPVVGLHSFEKKLDSIRPLNLISLRAGYFMENLLAQAGIIPSLGFMATPLRADLGLPMIATRDIGAVAADLLAKLNFSGKQTRELLGARNVSYAEAAKVIGPAVGRPELAYRQVPGAQAKPPMMQLGMSENMVDLLLEMIEALNSGQMRPLESRSAQNTTPTTIETFVTDVFVPAYRGRAARA
jgi:uncharacterized protein YbjT (DUF2867 family)